jgi:hypothetical protein
MAYPLLKSVPKYVYHMRLDCEWEAEIDNNMIERDIVTSVNIALYYTAFLQQSYYLKI